MKREENISRPTIIDINRHHDMPRWIQVVFAFPPYIIDAKTKKRVKGQRVEKKEDGLFFITVKNFNIAVRIKNEEAGKP